MEAASVVKSVIMAAKQYLNHKVDNNSTFFQRQLEVLIGITSSSSGTSLKFFNPRNMQPSECLTAVIEILCDSQTNPLLIMRCITLLHNLAINNEIREALYESFHITPSLASVLRRYGESTEKHLMVECLQLLETVTYGHKINFQELYVEDMLNFVINQIRGPVDELTQPCLGLLVNLCRDNFSVQSYIKNMDNSKTFYKTLMSYLGNQNFTIIILSLSVITNLCVHEDVGDSLFNTKNINQTFQTIFNILRKGDSGVTRKHAVDLFKDLLRNPKTQQSLTQFDKLICSIDHVLRLISSSDSDSVIKVFELFLCFCSVEGLRTLICKSLLSSSSLQDREHFVKALQLPVSQIKEPLFAIVHWSSQSVESCGQAPLYAIDFLTEFYEELIYSNIKVQYSAHGDLVLPMILVSLQSKLEGPSILLKRKCLKIVRALQLLIVLCGEDDIFKKVCKCTDMTLFSQLLEFQFINNSIVARSRKAVPSTDNWSEDGVDIVLYVLELMEKLRRSLPDVDGLFHSILQDNRIVSFLSAGLSSHNRSQVHTALMLFSIGTTLEAFPVVLLGDAIAANNVIRAQEEPKVTPTKKKDWQRDESWVQSSKETVSSLSNGNHGVVIDQETSINSLIEKMQMGVEMKDIKSSEIIDMYEHKLQSLQTKEEQLHDLLEAKTLALAQADRLIAQYRTRKAQYESEAQKMRTLQRESEKRNENIREKLNDISLHRERLTNELDTLTQEKQKLEQVVEEHKQLTAAYSEISERYESHQKSFLGLKQEHKTLSEMHEMLQKHNESLKHQHDVSSEQLSKLQDERKQLSKQLKEKDTKHTELTKSHQKLEKEHLKLQKEHQGLEEAAGKMKGNMEKFEQIKKQLEHKLSSIEIICHQQQLEIKEKDEQIVELKTNVEKHAQIAALIHSLSSDKSDASTTKS